MQPSSVEAPDDPAPWQDTSPAIVPRRQRDDTEMDITPMIDCTFLLLIFFLLTFKADEGATVALPPARYGVAVPAKNAVVLTIEKGTTGQPAKVHLGNTVSSESLARSSDAKALEEEIADYVEREMARGGRKKEYILIKAAQDVKHRDVAMVARAASRAAAVQELHVAVLEVE